MKNNRMFILLGVILAMMLSSLDQTIVSTAMPQIVRELNGLSQLSWVFTAYMLMSTITVPIYGKLSDIFGRRGLYILGIVVFLAGSALSGMSRNMTQLIIFRGLQGIGGGAMMVNSLALIGDIFPPAERGRWQGLLGGVFGLASIAGPFIGGWITDTFSWRWIFYVNLPIGALAIAVLLSSMPKIARNVKGRSIDYAGAALIILGLVPLLLGFVWGGSRYAWDSWEIIMLFGIAIVAIVTFALVEKKAREPVVSLNLFKNRVFTISVLTTFLTSMGMFGALLYIPVFAQGVVGVSATYSGLTLLPLMIAMIVLSAASGQIITKTGKYKLLTVAGMVFTVLGMFLFSQIGVTTTNLGLSARMIVLGLGLGITMPIFTIAIQSAFGQERLGEVTAGSQLFRSIGGTVGTAVLGGIMNAQLAKQLAGVANEPFVTTMKQLGPAAAAMTKINGNTIQGFLTPQGRAQVNAIIAKAPEAVQATLTSSFGHFLDAVKVAFSHSIDRLFLVGAAIMLVALIAVLFLPEIPLRKTNSPGNGNADYRPGAGTPDSSQRRE